MTIITPVCIQWYKHRYTCFGKKPQQCSVFWTLSNVVYLFSSSARKWSLSKSYSGSGVKNPPTKQKITKRTQTPNNRKTNPETKAHNNNLFQHVKTWGNMHTARRMLFHVYLTKKTNQMKLHKLLRGYAQQYSVKCDQQSKHKPSFQV